MHAVQVRDAGDALTVDLPLTGGGTLTLAASDVEIGRTLAQLRTVELLAGAGMIVVPGCC